MKNKSTREKKADSLTVILHNNSNKKTNLIREPFLTRRVQLRSLMQSRKGTYLCHLIVRSSHPELISKKAILNYFVKLRRKHLYCSFFIRNPEKFACPAEVNAGVSSIYIRNHLSYKTINDLNTYKSFELGSTFIEICNPKETNIIICCIYKDSKMEFNEFNDDYLTELLNKLSKENKTKFLVGDFNINSSYNN